MLVGASVGAGSAAIAAARGGADFVVAGNFGRLRMMGAPSCVCQLPLRDCNKLVFDFAVSEILPAVNVPVFFGASVAAPDLELKALVRAVREAGFDGICNIPSCVQFAGRYLEALNASGFGYDREVELLARAKDEGLLVLGYARTAEDVSRLIPIGPDMICLHFDPRLALDVRLHSVELDQTAGLARSLVDIVRRRSPATLSLCGGASVSSPEQMLHLCELMKADGYLGGSTIDQLPLERSIENRVAEFKAITDLRRREETSRKEMAVLGRSFQLSAHAEGTRALFARIARAARHDYELVITGAAGTGKTSICGTIHRLSRRRGRRLLTIACDESRDTGLDIELFGAVAGTRGSGKARIGLISAAEGCTLVLDALEAIPTRTQRKLLRILERKVYRPVGGDGDLPADVRLVFTSRRSLEDLMAKGAITDDLYLKLKPFEFHLPTLVERLEDLPLIIEQMLVSIRERINPAIETIEHAAVRHLQGQSWPGNLRDLLAALERAALNARGSEISLSDLRLTSAASSPKFTSERDWIMDALRRHKFRKAETAAFLGISRKTLYHKLKRYGSEASVPEPAQVTSPPMELGKVKRSLPSSST